MRGESCKRAILIATSLILMCCSAPSGGVQERNTQAPDKVSKSPEWVRNPPGDGGYVYGVGSAQVYGDEASALSRAEDRARVELVKRLRVKVKGETRTRVRRSVVDGKSRLTRSVVNSARSDIEETELSEIDIVKRTVSHSGKYAYALARLDRSEAEAAARQRIKRVDAELDRFFPLRSRGGYEELRRLLPALSLLEKRTQLVDQLHLVSKAASEPLFLENHRRLRQRILELLESLVVVLSPRGKAARALDSSLRKAMSDEGLRVRDRGPGDLVLRYEANLRTVYRDGVYFVFARGNASVLERGSDLVAEFKAQAKGGSTDRGLAKDRALRELAEELSSKLGEGLLQSL